MDPAIGIEAPSTASPRATIAAVRVREQLTIRRRDAAAIAACRRCPDELLVGDRLARLVGQVRVAVRGLEDDDVIAMREALREMQRVLAEVPHAG